MAVEIREMAELRQLGEEARRVVAEQDHLRHLQRHDAVGFGPAAVVAEAHADDAFHRPEHRESPLARSEIEQIGRASCRDRVCRYVYIDWVAVSLKNTTI